MPLTFRCIEKLNLQNFVNVGVNQEIEHSGTITGLHGNTVEVSVLSQSACASCQVKGVCGMSETEEKIVSVWVDHPEIYSDGEQVIVSISKGMGIKAVVYAYIYPFFLLLGVLVVLLLGFELGEVVSGLSAIGVVMVYYIGLFFLNHKIEREIMFKIRKI